MDNYIINEEVWKDVKGYEGCYQVSNKGRVKSLERTIRHEDGFHRSKKEIILKPGVHKRGYLFVYLHNESGGQHFYIHRLVAKAFIVNPENKPQVNHKDGVTSNNKVDNLEWATAKENAKHAYDTGLMKVPGGSPRALGSNNSGAKLSKIDVIDIRDMYKKGDVTQQELSNIFGVGRVQIHKIIKRKCWKHI